MVPVQKWDGTNLRLTNVGQYKRRTSTNVGLGQRRTGTNVGQFKRRTSTNVRLIKKIFFEFLSFKKTIMLYRMV